MNTVTQKQIDSLMENAQIDVKTIFDKCTVVTCKLANGFVLVESTGAVDKKNYSEKIGKEICIANIKNRLWEFEGYKLACDLYNICILDVLTFSDAIKYLKIGFKLARKGWNGKGIFIELQVPDENSKMSHPYIYIDTTGLDTENEFAPLNRVPWIASQTDMLSDDWMVVQ